MTNKQQLQSRIAALPDQVRRINGDRFVQVGVTPKMANIARCAIDYTFDEYHFRSKMEIAIVRDGQLLLSPIVSTILRYIGCISTTYTFRQQELCEAGLISSKTRNASCEAAYALVQRIDSVVMSIAKPNGVR